MKVITPRLQSGDQEGIHGPKVNLGSNFDIKLSMALKDMKGPAEVFGRNNTENAHTEKNDGNLEENSCHGHKNNTIKMWKKVTQSEEEENEAEGPNHVLLGKRKGVTEGSFCKEQRHLKIRKWEDYLEEEFEIEDEMAEAAEQPRQQP